MNDRNDIVNRIQDGLGDGRDKVLTSLPADAAVWVHDSGDVLVYASMADLEADRDNSRAVARHQVADPEALIAALIDAGIEYERG